MTDFQSILLCILILKKILTLILIQNHDAIVHSTSQQNENIHSLFQAPVLCQISKKSKFQSLRALTGNKLSCMYEVLGETQGREEEKISFLEYLNYKTGPKITSFGQNILVSIKLAKLNKTGYNFNIPFTAVYYRHTYIYTHTQTNTQRGIYPQEKSSDNMEPITFCIMVGSVITCWYVNFKRDVL